MSFLSKTEIIDPSNNALYLANDLEIGSSYKKNVIMEGVTA